MFGRDKKKTTQQLVTEVFDDHRNSAWSVRQRIWFRNILYYIGEQYLDYIVSANAFQRRLLPRSVPTPVSNIVRDYARSMKAMLLNKDYVIRCWPNSEEESDREAAKLSVQFLEDLEARNDEEFADEQELVALWIVIAGTAFMRTIPELERGQIAIDKNGELIPMGEVVSTHLIPFNVRVPDAGARLKDKKWLGIRTLKEIEWVEDTFHTLVKKGSIDKESVSYQRRLNRLVSQVSPWKGAGNANAIDEAPDADMCVFDEIEVKPTKTYPDGRYIVSVGGEVLKEFKKLPIPKDKDSRWFYTVTDFHYYQVPGSFWSDGGVNDQISPQNSVNSIDQQLEMNRKGIGRPMILSPVGMKMKRVNKGGVSYIHMEYDAAKSYGSSPSVHYGKPLPNQVMDERRIHKSVSQEAAGDPKNILGGQAPSSNASGLMVDILRDAAEQQHTPDIARFYRGIQRVKKKELLLAQGLYTEERMIKIGGKGSQVQVRAFKGSDLHGNTDVRMEKASGISSTAAGRTQTLITMVEKGLFGDVTTDPEAQQEIQRRMGLSGFKGKTSRDVERAEWENARITTAKKADYIVDEESGLLGFDGLHMVRNEDDPETGERLLIPVSFDPIFNFDNHDIHYETHRRFIVSPEFRVLSEKQKMCAMVHLETHRQEQVKQQAQQVMDQQITPGSDEDIAQGGESLDRSQAASFQA